jgi:hypothetical protein
LDQEDKKEKLDKNSQYIFLPSFDLVEKIFCPLRLGQGIVPTMTPGEYHGMIG